MARLVLASRTGLDRRVKLRCIRGETGAVHEFDGGAARSSGRPLPPRHVRCAPEVIEPT